MPHDTEGMVTVDLFELDIDWKCGCKQWVEGRKFNFAPCSETCAQYQTMLRAAIKRESRISYTRGH